MAHSDHRARITGQDTLVAQFTGAFIRALAVVLLIASPTLVLPAQSQETAQIVTLVALFSAILVFVEYASAYPSLIEFRDAPPFNRVRFVSLLLTVLLGAIVVRGQYEVTALTQFVTAIGALIGFSMDFPGSPVRLVIGMFPEDSDASSVLLIRALVGVSYLISLISLAVFAILMRLQSWPARDRVFNVWINLPTFDPTSGGDVVARLLRDARINILLGFILPFLIPMAMSSAAILFDPGALSSSQTLIWMVAIWAFLPASLFMRGIAMGRIAYMIREQRRQSYERSVADGYVPA